MFVMSSPLSNLKKPTKSPLKQPSSEGEKSKRQKGSPSQNPSSTVDRKAVGGAKSPVVKQSPKEKQEARRATSRHGAPPTDFELMSSMMEKISVLEGHVHALKKQLLEKDKRIVQLQETVTSHNLVRDNRVSAYTEMLEEKCNRLQDQVGAMEEFLNDYGMVWVGASASSSVDDRYDILPEPETEAHKPSHSKQKSWQPDSSVVSPKFEIDFDLLLYNIRSLNILAGEGTSHIEHTKEGARLKTQTPVSIKLYANGMIMFSGPFRLYTDPSTQQCLDDIMAGYFPSELQSRYPNGVPLLVTDERYTVYKDSRLDTFPGQGQTLDAVSLHSSKSLQSSNSLPIHQLVESSNSDSSLTAEQFCKKLPANVIKSGKVIDIRSSVKERLTGNDTGKGQNITLVETPVVNDMKVRLKSPKGKRPPSSKKITTLRIKSASDNQMYVLKMKYTDRISDLRNYIDAQRPAASKPYELVSAFPQQKYCNDRATLEDCGLVPNAVLHLVIKKNDDESKKKKMHDLYFLSIFSADMRWCHYL